jgi:hypothetical protein
VVEQKSLCASREIVEEELDLLYNNRFFLSPTKNNSYFLAQGAIASHIDGGTVHQAIILESGCVETFALFITSNPLWNKYSRKISKEEAALAGFHSKNIANTYLAPVIRSTSDFAVEIDSAFPLHRVESFKKEFLRWMADDC